MKVLILVLFVFLGLSSMAQQGIDFAPDSTSLEISIKQDPQIDRLLRVHKDIVTREKGISGFRVQIYSDSGNQSKLRTQRKKAEFDNKHPGVPSYVVFDAPDFKLRVGDFRTRLDARRFLEKIAREYEGAYIVVDNINFPGFD